MPQERELQAKIDELETPTDDEHTFRGQLLAFYAKHDPPKLDQLDSLVTRLVADCARAPTESFTHCLAD